MASTYGWKPDTWVVDELDAIEESSMWHRALVKPIDTNYYWALKSEEFPEVIVHVERIQMDNKHPRYQMWGGNNYLYRFYDVLNEERSETSAAENITKMLAQERFDMLVEKKREERFDLTKLPHFGKF